MTNADQEICQGKTKTKITHTIITPSCTDYRHEMYDGNSFVTNM